MGLQITSNVDFYYKLLELLNRLTKGVMTDKHNRILCLDNNIQLDNANDNEFYHFF